jgi:hypothetical protein
LPPPLGSKTFIKQTKRLVTISRTSSLSFSLSLSLSLSLYIYIYIYIYNLLFFCFQLKYWFLQAPSVDQKHNWLIFLFFDPEERDWTCIRNMGNLLPDHTALSPQYGSRHSHHVRASSPTKIIFPQRLIISCGPLLFRPCVESGQVVQGMKGQPVGVHQVACNSVNATGGSLSPSTYKYQPLSGGTILPSTVCWDLRVRVAGGGGVKLKGCDG